MSWFRVDDSSAFHAKVVRAGNDGWGAFCRAGAWSSAQGTDGFVPDEIAKLIAPAKVWAKAMAAGLVEKCDGGKRIHDFLQWNPSASDVEKTREELSEKRRKAGLAGNAKRWQSRRKTIAKPSQTSGACDCPCDDHDLANASPHPIPSHPIEDPPIVPQGGTVELELDGSPPSKVSDVDEVFGYWRERHMPKAKKTGDRVKKIRQRLKEGYTVNELCLAVDGVFHDNFLMGGNDQEKEYRDIVTIFKSGAKVDDLIKLAEQAVEASHPVAFDYPKDPPGTEYCGPPPGFFDAVNDVGRL